MYEIEHMEKKRILLKGFEDYRDYYNVHENLFWDEMSDANEEFDYVISKENGGIRINKCKESLKKGEEALFVVCLDNEFDYVFEFIIDIICFEHIVNTDIDEIYQEMRPVVTPYCYEIDENEEGWLNKFKQWVNSLHESFDKVVYIQVEGNVNLFQANDIIDSFKDDAGNQTVLISVLNQEENTGKITVKLLWQTSFYD